MPTIHDFFRREGVDMKSLSAFLDGLPPSRRAEETCDLNAAEQARLWEAAKGFLPVTLDSIVPQDRKPLEEVIHHGRNSLAMFSRFQKRFCLPGDGKKGELWGYNHQMLSPVTGPGYFVTRAAGPGEVVVDYREVPPAKPEEWPEILPNSAKLSRFIYYMTEDFLRGVSKHVTIGRATRKGKPMNNWFVLCRED